MCEFFSCIVDKDTNVYAKVGINSHSELVTQFNLNERNDKLFINPSWAKIEITPPVNNYSDYSKIPVEDWKFRIDEEHDIPWFEDRHKNACLLKLKMILKEMKSEYCVEHSDGDKYYYKRGKLHRDGDEPAIIFADGTKYYCKKDQLHRDGDEPAIIFANGEKQYYKRGKFIKREV